MQYTPNTVISRIENASLNHIIHPRPDNSLIAGTSGYKDYFDDEHVGYARRAAFIHLCGLLENSVREIDKTYNVIHEVFSIFYHANKLLDLNATPSIRYNKTYNNLPESNYIETEIYFGYNTNIICKKTWEAESIDHDNKMKEDFLKTLVEYIDTCLFRLAVGSSIIDELHRLRRFVYMDEYTTRVMSLVDTVLKFRKDTPMMERVVEKFSYAMNRRKYCVGMAARPLLKSLYAVRKVIQRRRYNKLNTIDHWNNVVKCQIALKKKVIQKFKHKAATKRRIKAVKRAIAEKDVCAICIHEFDTETRSTVTKCDHVFHTECFSDVVTRNHAHDMEMPCPVCRTTIMRGLDESIIYPDELSTEDQ
jgi:hypothetical protein